MMLLGISGVFNEMKVYIHWRQQWINSLGIHIYEKLEWVTKEKSAGSNHLFFFFFFSLNPVWGLLNI